MVYLEPEAFSEPWHVLRTMELFLKIVNKLYEINIMSFFNTGVILILIVFIPCKNSMGSHGAGDHEFEYTIKLLKILHKY